MRIARSVLAALTLMSFSSVALADDWIAERLRGGVQQYEGGNWVVLERGDVVPDGGKVRTTGTGRVDLVRGQESIALGPNTQIAVRDATGQKMTSVIQSSGVVTVTAEKRNVQHFSVQTPVLAAVVKGTQFTVTYRNGQARVDVDNGVVQVQDNVHDMVVDVTRGQSAAASQATPLDISGPGASNAVFLIDGEPVPAAARAAVLDGNLPAKAALEAVKTGGVPNINARVNAGSQGSAVSANVRLGLGNGGNGNGNGRNGVTASVGVGNGGASASAGAGNANASASVGGGNGVSVNVGVGNNGNGNGQGGNGNGGGANVDVDLGIVDVDVSVGGGNGLGLGLGLLGN
tara:strand:- start:77 stop:1114 length:1038 start_codon:yes stop_codon:yes gene_type:complete